MVGGGEGILAEGDERLLKLGLEGGNRGGEMFHGMVGAGEAGKAIAQGIVQAEGSRAGEERGNVAAGEVGGKGAIETLDGIGGGELLVYAFQGGTHPFRLDGGRDGNAGEVDELGGEAGEKVGEGGH